MEEMSVVFPGGEGSLKAPEAKLDQELRRR